jgi:predicted enzyme related to lactoylglutathione lyase
MARVTGIGGVFFKATNPESLREWYGRHLGLDIQPWGGAVFQWRELEAPDTEGATVWSLFPMASDYFGSGTAQFMVNYRVKDLHQVLAALREEGCTVDERVDESELGKFGWVVDPEGNRLELWEPPAAPPAG